MGYDREYKQGQSPLEPLEVIKERATEDQANIETVLSSINLLKLQGKSETHDAEIEPGTGKLTGSVTNTQTEPVNQPDGVINITDYSANPSGFGYKLRQDRISKKAA